MRGKSYDYIVVCRNHSHKLADGVSQLMLFLALVVFVSSFQAGLSKSASIWLYVVIAAVTGWLVRSYYVQKKKGNAYYRIGLLAAAVGWGLVPDWQWISAVYFLAALIEKQVKFPVEFAFDKTEIVLNSLPRKHYNWDELNNVVIKDGILTIDLKNNRLIQKEIENPGSDREESDFNEFCREQLLRGSAGTKQAAISE